MGRGWRTCGAHSLEMPFVELLYQIVGHIVALACVGGVLIRACYFGDRVWQNTKSQKRERLASLPTTTSHTLSAATINSQNLSSFAAKCTANSCYPSESLPTLFPELSQLTDLALRLPPPSPPLSPLRSLEFPEISRTLPRRSLPTLLLTTATLTLTLS